MTLSLRFALSLPIHNKHQTRSTPSRSGQQCEHSQNPGFPRDRVIDVLERRLPDRDPTFVWYETVVGPAGHHGGQDDTWEVHHWWNSKRFIILFSTLTQLTVTEEKCNSSEDNPLWERPRTELIEIFFSNWKTRSWRVRTGPRTSPWVLPLPWFHLL